MTHNLLNIELFPEFYVILLETKDQIGIASFDTPMGFHALVSTSLDIINKMKNKIKECGINPGDKYIILKYTNKEVLEVVE